MHLGMTGRFTESRAKHRASSITTPGTTKSTTMSCSRCRAAPASCSTTRAASASWTCGRATTLSTLRALRRHGPRADLDDFSGAYLHGGLAGQEDAGEVCAARPECRGRPRQHLCVRGAVPVGDIAHEARGAIRRDSWSGWPSRSQGDRGGDRPPAARHFGFQGADGELGYFQHGFRFYDREGEPCLACERPVKRLVQSGRSTFYCASARSDQKAAMNDAPIIPAAPPSLWPRCWQAAVEAPAGAGRRSAAEAGDPGNGAGRAVPGVAVRRRQRTRVWLEIGFGGGEHLAGQAAQHPDVALHRRRTLRRRRRESC